MSAIPNSTEAAPTNGEQVSPGSFAQLLAKLEPRHRKLVRAYLHEPNARKAALKAGYSEKSARSTGPEALSIPAVREAVEAGFAEQAMKAQEVLWRTAEVAASTMEDFLSIKRVRYTEQVALPADEALDLVADAVATASEQLESATGDLLDWLTGELRRLRRLERKCERALSKADSERAEPQVVVDVAWKERVEVRLDFEQARDAGKLHLIKKLKETKFGVEIELYDAAQARELLGKHYRLWSERVSLENPDGSPIKFIVGVPEDAL